MKQSRLIVLLLLLAFGGFTLSQHAAAQEDNQAPEGFTALFNGKDLSGWTGGTTRNPAEIAALPQAERAAWQAKMQAGIAKHWRVENGELINDGHEPHLITTQGYGDFEMWVDWKLSKNGDSGVYLRDTPQVQIWDPTNKAAHGVGSDKGSGGLWNNQKHERHPTQVADKPIGQWNRMYIRMVGQYVTVRLNDKLVVDNVVMENFFNRELPVLMRGAIHLQTHGSETRFKNIFVRSFSDEESNKLLTEIAGTDEGYTPLFNGKNLDGWFGAVDNYEVVDGAIRCKSGKGGNLLAVKQYADFAVRLEFKLPPGGNNGLAIRTPSADVDSAHAAMELQVLDNTAEKFATLEKYQYRPPRLPPARRPVEPPRSDHDQRPRPGLPQRLQNPRHPPGPGQARSPRSQADRGVLRLRRPPRPGRLSQHPDPRDQGIGR
jgi:hypothetical protein